MQFDGDDGNLPFSAASERNAGPILEVLREQLADCRSVLEIGSGTGQHAMHFARAMPWLTWQTSDRRGNLEGIARRLGEAGLPNTPAPVLLDVHQAEWPAGPFDAVFSANTLHIMAWPDVEDCFRGLPGALIADATVVVYGPFNVDGRYTSTSNQAFDAELKTRGAHMGIRDLEAVNRLARDSGLALAADIAMPANNRCLVWRRDVRQGNCEEPLQA